jgi:hypothetical protein
VVDRVGLRRCGHVGGRECCCILRLHKALLSLGVLTILSTTVFGSLKSEDGRAVSQQKAIHRADDSARRIITSCDL